MRTSTAVTVPPQTRWRTRRECEKSFGLFSSSLRSDSKGRCQSKQRYGAQTTAARKFLSGIKELIQRAGLDLDIKNPNFNIGPKYNGFIDQVANELVQTGKVTKEDI